MKRPRIALIGANFLRRGARWRAPERAILPGVGNDRVRSGLGTTRVCTGFGRLDLTQPEEARETPMKVAGAAGLEPATNPMNTGLKRGYPHK